MMAIKLPDDGYKDSWWWLESSLMMAIKLPDDGYKALGW